MAKRVVRQQKTITREILVEEISSVERRFDAKIDSTAQLFKEYVDSRIAPLQVDMGMMRGISTLDGFITK